MHISRGAIIITYKRSEKSASCSESMNVLYLIVVKFHKDDKRHKYEPLPLSQ